MQAISFTLKFHTLQYCILGFVVETAVNAHVFLSFPYIQCVPFKSMTRLYRSWCSCLFWNNGLISGIHESVVHSFHSSCHLLHVYSFIFHIFFMDYCHRWIGMTSNDVQLPLVQFYIYLLPVNKRKRP